MQRSFLTEQPQDGASQDFSDPQANGGTPPAAFSLANLFILVTLTPGQLLLALPGRVKTLTQNGTQLNRSAAHLVFILLAVLAVSLSKLPLTGHGLRAIRPLKLAPAQSPAPAPEEAEEAEDAGTPLSLPATLNTAEEDDVLVRAAVPHTIIPDRSRPEISTYAVEAGDTIFGIADKFGLAPETILWANSDLEANPDWLWVGQELTILPVDGVYHQVGQDDTLETIAATYKVEPAAIINYPLNELDPDNPVIEAGQWLVVPGGQKPFVPRTVTAYSGPVPENATSGTGIFGWPTSGTITQAYWAGHKGLDIAGWLGAPIAASDSGHVVYSGWDDTGYGNMIVIDHSNGFQTLYAHLQTAYVSAGDNVSKGQQIAEMGSTGRSTGPHLHFEIRQGTILRNPIGFLP